MQCLQRSSACLHVVPVMVVAVQCGVFAVGLAHILVAAEPCVVAEECPQSSVSSREQCQQQRSVSAAEQCQQQRAVPA